MLRKNNNSQLEKVVNQKNILTELANKEISIKSYPIFLGFDPVNACNLKCPFCTNHKRRNNENNYGTMSFSDFKLFINQIGKYLVQINFGDKNEPLLNKDIFRMISYVKNKFNISTKLSTNLNKFNKNDAEILVRSGLNFMCIGADGTNQKTYQKYRIGGDFKKVISNIKNIVKAKKRLKSDTPYIEWAYVVFKHNESEMKKAVEMAKELEISMNFILGNIYDIDKNYKKWLPKNKSNRQYEINSKSGKPVVTYLPKQKYCDFPWHTIAVDANGFLYPCTGEHTDDAIIGNIIETPFDKLWKNRKMINIRSYITSRKLINNAGIPCKNCLNI